VTNAHKPGDKATVTDERDGQSHSIQLTLATRPFVTAPRRRYPSGRGT
jgi:hypothetical protein